LQPQVPAEQKELAPKLASQSASDVQVLSSWTKQQLH